MGVSFIQEFDDVVPAGILYGWLTPVHEVREVAGDLSIARKAGNHTAADEETLSRR